MQNTGRDTPTDRTPPTKPSPDQGGLPSRDRQGNTEIPGQAGTPDRTPDLQRPADHEGATEDQVGDRTGPGVGYDQEPEPEPAEPGVS